jgi:hypothetical protein
MPVRKTRGTPRTIAAHLSYGPVGVVKIPGKIGYSRVLNENETIGSNGKHPPAYFSGKIRLFGERNSKGPVIDDNKIVAGTTHFFKDDGKGQFHH